jgi:hypothetical protein
MPSRWGGPALPEGVRSIYVPVFENASVEPDAGAIFAEALAASLAQVGRAGGASAGAAIQGEVLWVTSNSLATGSTGTGVGLYRITARVRLSLMQDGKLLCRRELEAGEDFLPARDLLGLEALRRTALRRLATTLMQGAEYKLCPRLGS